MNSATIVASCKFKCISRVSRLRARAGRQNRWLDSVFHALYEDLRAYFAWLSEEERWAAEDADGEASDDDVDDRLLSSAEWIYRAEIAKRLQNLSDAERAYRCAGRHMHPNAMSHRTVQTTHTSSPGLGES